MELDLTFKQVLEFAKRENPDTSEVVDKLLGFGIFLTAAALPSSAGSILALITPKNELTKLAKGTLNKLTKAKDDDFVKRQTRMRMAYGLMCYTAFFEALDRKLPESLRSKLRLQNSDKVQLSRAGIAEAACNISRADDADSEAVEDGGPLDVALHFPHPTETLEQQQRRLNEIYTAIAGAFKAFIRSQDIWTALDDKTRYSISTDIDAVPALASEIFEAQYFELAQKYEDFAVWANLQEHKKGKALLGTLSDYVKRQAEISEKSSRTADIGFRKLNEVVLSIPNLLKTTQAQDIADALKRHYAARIEDPIIKDDGQGSLYSSRLRFPRVVDAFIPQSYRVLLYRADTQRLEDDATWNNINRRSDLGPFLLKFLSSPYSTEAPLLILGHPGSGKSLLTSVLAAQLASSHYCVIRVPLREVNSDAAIINQIEEYVGRVTGHRVDSWAKLATSFQNNPPVIILDGYDELLQASGKVFSNYLRDAQAFQRNEAELGRPVRVVVTSRITLIDKATVPIGSTVLRLLEFDARQREQWSGIWNKTNAAFFKETKVEKFQLPDASDAHAGKILALAEQPLLLLMLALYDSERNDLKQGTSLDRTALYDSLLRRFIVRERSKDREFGELQKTERAHQIDLEMSRLGVAAVGMYNRRKLHILGSEVSDDLKFFDLERRVKAAAGRQLEQSDMLLGSFFFVHKSQAQQTAGADTEHDVSSAFEFLHNTFGEFLTCDFILRNALDQTQILRELRKSSVLRAQTELMLDTPDGLSKAWFACLIYTPLHTRPVILEMMTEWIKHTLQSRKIAPGDFAENFDLIVTSQIRHMLEFQRMPALIRGDLFAPFGSYPLLGHLAIYSLNLVLLRSALVPEPFLFREELVASKSDGSRPWDQLIHLWRSWFPLDALASLSAVIHARREASGVQIRYRGGSTAAYGTSRLQKYYEIASTLGDNVAAAVSGLVLTDCGGFFANPTNNGYLEHISKCAEAEKIDMSFALTYRKWVAEAFAGTSLGRGELNEFNAWFASALSEALEDAAGHGNTQPLMQLLLLARSVSYGRRKGSLMLLPLDEEDLQRSNRRLDIFYYYPHPRAIVDLGFRHPELLRELIEVTPNLIAHRRESLDVSGAGAARRSSAEYALRSGRTRYAEYMLERILENARAERFSASNAEKAIADSVVLIAKFAAIIGGPYPVEKFLKSGLPELESVLGVDLSRVRGKFASDPAGSHRRRSRPSSNTL